MMDLASIVMDQLGFLPFSVIGPRNLRPKRMAIAFRLPGPTIRFVPYPRLLKRKTRRPIFDDDASFENVIRAYEEDR